MLESNRNNAISLLKGKRDGTFLIRKSSREGCYALSIVCDGEIGHCQISHSENGFGFIINTDEGPMEDLVFFASLKELVLHYSTNSLEGYNKKLKTMLLYPAGAPIQTPQHNLHPVSEDYMVNDPSSNPRHVHRNSPGGGGGAGGGGGSSFDNSASSGAVSRN